MAAAPKPHILHEDEYLIALDKPGGLLSHGAEEVPSALRWLRERETAAGRDADRVHLVHRLDKDTSGVLVLAYSSEIAGKMGEMFRDRKVLKVYLALTSPVPALRWQRTELQMRPKRLGGGEFMQVVPEDGVQADSEIEVLARGRRFGLVRVIPEQGRKHQVRVALAATGSPICGDFLYGGNLVARLAKRVMLHARSLEFAHPVTGVHTVFKAGVPVDFRQMIAEDGGNIPPDLDRRHRTEPKQHDRAKTASQPQQTERSRALAAQVVPPRAQRPVRKPK